LRVALRLIQSSPELAKDLVAYEELNVKGMVKSRLAKSINDAAWSTFKKWLEYFASKYGKIAVAVPPYNTSQDCSNCGEKVQTRGLSPLFKLTRTHICPYCGFVEDRDVNAAINILKKALKLLSTVGRTETLGATR